MSALNRKIKQILAESGQPSRAAARIEELVRERSASHIEEVEAERDAALAAIERVRAILSRKPTAGSGFYLNPDRTELDMLRDLYDDRFADELVAALDGAPEPE